MRQLLLPIAACCAVLLPVSQAKAREFGGFKPGKTFTFTVSNKISTKATLLGVTKQSPVPDGIPNYKIGQKVKFTIGYRGKLMAKDLSMPFKEDGGTANVYFVAPKGSVPSGNIAQVFKTRTNRPTGVNLSFFKAKGTGLSTTVHSVYYTLK